MQAITADRWNPRSVRVECRKIGEAMKNILTVIAVILVLASHPGCGSPEAAAVDAKVQMREELTPGLGPALAGEVSAAGEPVFADLARMQDAGESRDFKAYHAAVLSLRTTYAKAVDDTIQALDGAADQSWRRRLLTDATGTAPPADAQARGDALRELFPSGEGDESADTKAWYRGHLISNPRECGEIMRAAVEMQYEGARLSVYFVGAVGGEALKAANEAYEGFTEPRPRAE